jgi:hypothetical protein
MRVCACYLFHFTLNHGNTYLHARTLTRNARHTPHRTCAPLRHLSQRVKRRRVATTPHHSQLEHEPTEIRRQRADQRRTTRQYERVANTSARYCRTIVRVRCQQCLTRTHSCDRPDNASSLDDNRQDLLCTRHESAYARQHLSAIARVRTHRHACQRILMLPTACAVAVRRLRHRSL